MNDHVKEVIEDMNAESMVDFKNEIRQVIYGIENQQRVIARAREEIGNCQTRLQELKLTTVSADTIAAL